MNRTDFTPLNNAKSALMEATLHVSTIVIYVNAIFLNKMCFQTSFCNILSIAMEFIC